MYFVLYDRNYKTIGQTYILESWSRIQRAVDFDSLSLVGEQISYTAEPFFVVANDRQGKQLFSGLASTPQINDLNKKTQMSLKDYATLFNTEILIDWSLFSGTSVSEYLDFILNLWLQQSDPGFSGISWDLTFLQDYSLDESILIGSGIESVLVSDLVFNAINYYSLYYTVDLSIARKQLMFSFFKSGTHNLSIRLEDFNLKNIEKSFGEYNRATVYDAVYSVHQQWALCSDNSIVKLPTNKDLVYPAKNRNFIASDENNLSDAIYDAVMGLAENRYQETFEINVSQYKFVIDLSNLDFSYMLLVYFEGIKYKSLPVGEIETDSSGKHIIRLGYRIQELTQEI